MPWRRLFGVISVSIFLRDFPFFFFTSFFGADDGFADFNASADDDDLLTNDRSCADDTPCTDDAPGAVDPPCTDDGPFRGIE